VGGATRALLRYKWLGPSVALALVYVVFFALKRDTFGTIDNLATMAQQTVVVGLTTAGMTLVIVHGGIDLSVGSGVALGTVVVALLSRAGYAAFACAVGGIATGAIGGLANGLLVTRLRLAPFIATLGTMSAFRGLAKGLANEQKIDADARGLDALASAAPERTWLLVAPGVWMLAIIALLVAAMLRYTRFGRHVFAVGSNEANARLAGVHVERVKLGVYVLAGTLVGFASVIAFGRLTVGDPTTSDGLELQAIAAVVIGGASLAGGEGSVAGALVGAFLLTVIGTGATHLGLPNWVQQIVTGAIIVSAAALDRLRRR
jgi:ribose transport system permease protein